MAEKQVYNLFQLTPSEMATLTMIFEDCTNALAIYRENLKRIFQLTKNTKIPCVLYELQNFETTTDKEIFNEDMKKMLKNIQEEAAFIKLQNDSLHVSKIMNELKKEIRENRSYNVLKKEIERIARREMEEKTLFEELERKKKTVTELRRILANEKINNEVERTRLRNILLDLKKENEELKIITEVEYEYSCKWNKSKCQQSSIKFNYEREKLQKILDDLEEREKKEKLVSDKLVEFLTQDITSIEGKIEEWQIRYDRESKMYEEEIREVSIDIETRQKDLAELSQVYNERQKFIDVYLAEKEAMKRQKERERYVEERVVRIQAWWRGVMVRRKLGPYRPEEKKKKRSQTKTKK